MVLEQLIFWPLAVASAYALVIWDMTRVPDPSPRVMVAPRIQQAAPFGLFSAGETAQREQALLHAAQKVSAVACVSRSQPEDHAAQRLADALLAELDRQRRWM